MEKSIIEKSLKALDAELLLLDDTDLLPVKRLRQAMPIIARSIDIVKNHVKEHGFEDEADEIYFFKHFKPRFYAQQIYEILVYHLQMQQPIGTPEKLKAYFEEELEQVNRFFELNRPHMNIFGRRQLFLISFTFCEKPIARIVRLLN